MPLTKRAKSAAHLFSVPPRRFGPKINVHSDERGCHAYCRACGWSNPPKQDRSKRDRAAWGHEKRCKKQLPKPKHTGLRKKRKPRGRIEFETFDFAAANKNRAIPEAIEASITKSIRGAKSKVHKEAESHLAAVKKGNRRGKRT